MTAIAMDMSRPLDEFFISHSFPPTPPGIHPHTHFLALVASRGWAPNSRTHRHASSGFNTALMGEFARRFGNESNPKLDTWQTLCFTLRKEVPKSITQCKKMVKRTHVNLVDLMAGVELRIFRNRSELEEYTRQTGRYFPRREAKVGGGLLRCLLREIPTGESGETFDGTAASSGRPS